VNGGHHLPHDWYPAPLPDNVEIGDGTWLYSAFAFLHCRSTLPNAIRIGPHCGIYNGCFFELGAAGRVEIGAYSALVGVIVATNGRVTIGDYCFLAHEVVIADSFAAAPDASPAGPADASEFSVALGDDVWVGAGAVLLKGARIGSGAIIGAGAVVDFVVPDGAIVAGNPARIVGSSSGKPGGGAQPAAPV
jgi:acetyltransferase-like isoleucine patch superfamily enzyme